MDSTLVIAKTVLSSTTPFVRPFVDAMIRPHLDRFTEWAKAREGDVAVLQHRLINRFEDYIQRTLDRCLILNTLVFPNQQIDIHRLYLPMRLSAVGRGRTYKADQYKRSFARYRRVLISDAAGMGKSTLMRWLCISVIKKRVGIPVFIEMRKIRQGHTILHEFFSQLDPIGDTFDRALTYRLFTLGEFIFFFDGYDEVPLEEQEGVAAQIKELTSKAGQNTFLLTSRPEASLASFGDFQQFTVDPLAREEAYALIRRYDEVGGFELRTKLIDDLQQGPSEIHGFLENPFLVSLLYKTYIYNRNIPSKTITFFDEVYQALYKYHDLTKDAFRRNKRSALDIHDFRLVLRRLAFDGAKIGQIEHSYVELSDLIRRASEKIPTLRFGVDDFLSDLILAVPLFLREGNVYKWAHKSIQDYFCAEFIAFSERKDEILERIWAAEAARYLSVLTFYSELDPVGFRRVLVAKLLDRYLQYLGSSYGTVQASSSHIALRQALTFGVDAWFSKVRSHEGEAVIERKAGANRMNLVIKMPAHGVYLTYDFGFLAQLVRLVLDREKELIRSTPMNYEAMDDSAKLVEVLADPPLMVTDEVANPLNTSSVFPITTAYLLYMYSVFVDRPRRGEEVRLLDSEASRNMLERISTMVKDSKDIADLGEF